MINRLLRKLGWQLVRLRENRQFKATAKTIMASPESTEMARLNAEIILAALAEGRPICRHCFNPFEYKPRSFPENVRLRAVLMIPDAAPDPMICDNCAYTVVTAYNTQSTNVGTRNDGPTNLVLAKFG